MPTPPTPDWPDVTERDHWAAVLADAAERVRRERGVVDPWRLEVEPSRTWAHYGGLSILVGGPEAEVLNPEQLSDEIDTWVAFERPDGPGRVLERDLQAMAEWRAQLPGLQRMWEVATTRVFLDVRTTPVELDWRVAVHEDHVDLSAWHRWAFGCPSAAGATPVEGLVAYELEDPDARLQGPPTRPLAFPQIYLETHAGSGSSSDHHLGGAGDVDDAVLDVAGTVQDLGIEELHGACPVCPDHWHPLQPVPSATGPVWHCPNDERVAVPIGRLVELAASEGDAQA